MDRPIFNSLLYQKISSRLGRIKSKMKTRQLGSNSYIRLSESLKRTNNLRNKLISEYLTELAIYIVDSGIEVSMYSLQSNDIIMDDRLVSILLDNWKQLQIKVNKVKNKIINNKLP